MKVVRKKMLKYNFISGTEFNNAVVDELFKLSGVKHHISSAYHPQMNGIN